MDKQQKGDRQPKINASSLKKDLKTITKQKKMRIKARPHVAVLSTKKDVMTISKQKNMPIKVPPHVAVLSTKKNKDSSANPKKMNPAKSQPYITFLSPMENVNIRAIPKTIHPVKAQAGPSGLSPKENVNICVKPETIDTFIAQAGPSGLSPKKNVTTGIKPEKNHPDSVNIGNIIQKVRSATVLSEVGKNLKPVNVRVVKSLSDLLLLSSKKHLISEIKPEKIRPASLSPEEFSTSSQIFKPDPPINEECEISDWHSLEPSISNGIQDKIQIQDLFLSETWEEGDKKCMGFCTHEDSKTVISDPLPKMEQTENPGDVSNAIEVIELSDSLSDSENSRDESDAIEVIELSDSLSDSSLNSKQKIKEDLLLKSFLKEDINRNEFYGKGSSDIEFLQCSPPSDYDPPLVLGQPLNRLEEWAHNNLHGIEEIVLD